MFTKHATRRNPNSASVSAHLNILIVPVRLVTCCVSKYPPVLPGDIYFDTPVFLDGASGISS